jgi:hypothetical protein
MTTYTKMRFADHNEDAPSASDQERLDCLAACIVNQQNAGFGSYLDVREMHCADCGASGFNTGWGFWEFACGLEVLTDGEPSVPCSRTPPPPTAEDTP